MVGCLNPGIGVKPDSENWIDLRDVRTVEQVEEFRDNIQTLRTSEREILKDAEVHGRQRRRFKTRASDRRVGSSGYVNFS